MDDVTAPPGLPLWSAYPAFVRRRLLPIGALSLLGLLAGLGVAATEPASYSATASVVLTPVPKYLTPSTTTLVPPPVTIDTDAQLLQSPEVLGAVSEALGGTDSSVSEAQAADAVSVSASPNTRVLHVTVTAASAARAGAAANAAVAALGDVRRTTLGSLRADQLRQLRLLIDQQEQLLRQEQAKQVVVPAYDTLATDVLQLQSDLDELEEAQAHPLQVVDPATTPRHADYRNAEVPLVSGAMLGLLCGCLVGAALDRGGSAAPHLTRLAARARALGRRVATAPLTSTHGPTSKDYPHAT